VSGLLIAGHVVDVPGLNIRNPVDTPWCRLHPRDYRARRTSWVRQIIVHTTKGNWPQHVIPGAGPTGRAKSVADYWYNDPRQSAAHIVIGSEGAVACLADLATVNAYHATVSNDWSIGIELYQESDGGIYAAVYDSAVRLIVALCEHLLIPLQVPGRVYPNAPMQRMVHGGPDMVGVFGHRDNTGDRGRGDPGDEIFSRLVTQACAEQLDYDNRQDLAVWKRRQLYLNNVFREQLDVDGICGPSTIAALKRHGFASGRAIPV
jgi:hypothetical protein